MFSLARLLKIDAKSGLIHFREGGFIIFNYLQLKKQYQRSQLFLNRF